MWMLIKFDDDGLLRFERQLKKALVDIAGSGMLRDVLLTKSFMRSSTLSLQSTGTRSAPVNSTRG